MRRDVCRHPDGDAGRAVDQEVGELRGQDGGLLGRRRVVRAEVDRTLTDLGEHLLGNREHAALGVPVGRRRVAVDRAEVAVAVDQRVAEHERLGHPDECEINRIVAVRVIALHHLAGDRGRLDIAAVGPDAQIGPHRVQDPPLNGFESVADVRKGTRRDDRECIVEVARPRDLGQRNVLDDRLRRPLFGPPRVASFPLRHRWFPSAFAASSGADRASVPTPPAIPPRTPSHRGRHHPSSPACRTPNVQKVAKMSSRHFSFRHIG